uniref:Uncharacterized protein n=1 Tax=Wuchereria bancrofti TaxID=6293 RepID=A0AAF5RUU0_WUCBA
MRQGGIEPPSIAWKATMLTITPLTPIKSKLEMRNFNEFIYCINRF